MVLWSPTSIASLGVPPDHIPDARQAQALRLFASIWPLERRRRGAKANLVVSADPGSALFVDISGQRETSNAERLSILEAEKRARAARLEDVERFAGPRTNQADGSGDEDE